MRYKKDRLDYYLVKKARAKEWMQSEEHRAYDAALQYFISLNTKPGQTVYIHTKHEYDGDIQKQGFTKRIKIDTWVVL